MQHVAYDMDENYWGTGCSSGSGVEKVEETRYPRYTLCSSDMTYPGTEMHAHELLQYYTD